ncbi:MAG TPA: anthrone oxygenase family protein [Acidimicrobiales bacterium]
MLTQYRGPALLAATLLMGLVAGVFDLYAHTIMRGLDKTDDRTFVGAFQEIDKAIINPFFMLTFFGALVLSGAAALLYLRDDGSSVLPWVVAAFVLYLTAVVITMVVNVPLNDDIKAAGDPDQINDLAAVREAFHASRWTAWNVVRAIATTVAFGCLAWALVLHGRISDSSSDTSAPAQEQAELGSMTSGS